MGSSSNPSIRQINEMDTILGRLTTGIILTASVGVLVVLLGVAFKTKEISCQERAERVVFNVPLEAKFVHDSAALTQLKARNALSKLFDPKIAKQHDVTFSIHPAPYVDEVTVATVDYESRLASHGLRVHQIQRKDNKAFTTSSQAFSAAGKNSTVPKNGGANSANKGAQNIFVMSRIKPLDLCEMNQMDITPSYNVDMDIYNDEILALVVPKKAGSSSSNVREAEHKLGQETGIPKIMVEQSTLFTRKSRHLKTTTDLVTSYPSLRQLNTKPHAPLSIKTDKVEFVQDAVTLTLKNGAQAKIGVTLSVWDQGAELSITSVTTESHILRHLYEAIFDHAKSMKATRSCSGDHCLSPLPHLIR